MQAVTVLHGLRIHFAMAAANDKWRCYSINQIVRETQVKSSTWHMHCSCESVCTSMIILICMYKDAELLVSRFQMSSSLACYHECPGGIPL